VTFKTPIFVRADDFASCRSANQAIIQSVRAGVLKNVGVMGPGLISGLTSANEVAELKSLDVAIGLHLALNSEWNDVKWVPCSSKDRIPTLLTEDGEFWPTPLHLHERGYSVEDAVTEARAQLQRLRKWGIEPVYWDDHMGVTWIRDLRPAIDELMASEGIPTWENCTGLKAPEYGSLSPASVVQAFQESQTVGKMTLWVLHPGFDQTDMQQFIHVGLEPGQVAWERQQETNVLCDPGLGAALSEAGFHSVRIDQY
jgi:chitin disaccharide deacetylase